DQLAFQTAGGLDDEVPRLMLTHQFADLLKALRVVGQTPLGSLGPDGQIEEVPGNIYSKGTRLRSGVRHKVPSLLMRVRASDSSDCSGSGVGGRPGSSSPTGSWPPGDRISRPAGGSASFATLRPRSPRVIEL